MKGKETTNDALARMVKEGFDQTATKEQFHTIEKRLGQVDTRLDRIENLLLQDHLNRIERLEDDIRILKTKAGVK